MLVRVLTPLQSLPQTGKAQAAEGEGGNSRVAHASGVNEIVSTGTGTFHIIPLGTRFSQAIFIHQRWPRGQISPVFGIAPKLLKEPIQVVILADRQGGKQRIEGKEGSQLAPVPHPLWALASTSVKWSHS